MLVPHKKFKSSMRSSNSGGRGILGEVLSLREGRGRGHSPTQNTLYSVKS